MRSDPQPQARDCTLLPVQDYKDSSLIQSLPVFCSSAIPNKMPEYLKILTDIVGVDSIGWRYDPILVDAAHTVE